MKISPVLFAFFITAIFTDCNSKKQTVSDKKIITLEFAEIYCGGASPPDELIQEMSRLKPMSNRNVEVYLDHNPDSKPKNYKTNDKGQITVSTKLGKQVFINVYPSAEEYKIDKDEYRCYKAFIIQNLITVDLTSTESEIKLTALVRCNPCIPAAP